MELRQSAEASRYPNQRAGLHQVEHTLRRPAERHERGSSGCARAEDAPGSDVDVLVVTSGPGERGKVEECAETERARFFRRFGRSLSVHCLAQAFSYLAKAQKFLDVAEFARADGR